MTVFASRALLREYLQDMAIVSISSLIRQAYVDGTGGKMVATIESEVVKLSPERAASWRYYLSVLVPRCEQEAMEYKDIQQRLLQPPPKRTPRKPVRRR